MNLVSVREKPHYVVPATRYLQTRWPEVYPMIYEDCITYCINARHPLPQWYLLEWEGQLIGCTGLITNDFISRMDLYPWLCALFIEESHRGKGYASRLIEDARQAGFQYLNLCTDHSGLYEKYGFYYIGPGYHPWEAAMALCRGKSLLRTVPTYKNAG